MTQRTRIGSPVATRLVIATAALLFASALPAVAQQEGKLATVGVLSTLAGRHPIDNAFEQSLERFGWRRDQNIRIEYRYAAGRQEAFAPLAAELVGLGVDVLVAGNTEAAVAAKRATTRIPIVFGPAADPVRFGLVSSLARPGRNITGVRPPLRSRRMPSASSCSRDAFRLSAASPYWSPLTIARCIP